MFDSITISQKLTPTCFITAKFAWLEIACPSVQYPMSIGRWENQKNMAGSVQCCNSDGVCTRKTAGDVCYVAHTDGCVGFYQARMLCENDGQRLCTREETLANKCCDKGCEINRLLVWTSEISAAGVMCGGLRVRGLFCSPALSSLFSPQTHSRLSHCRFVWP